MITSQHSNAQTANSSSSTFSKCNGLRVIYPVVKTFSWRFTADIYQRHQISSHVIIVSSPDTKKGSGHFYPPWGNCFWNLCIDTQLSSRNETHFVITWDVIAKETILCQGLKILGTCHNIDKNWHRHKWDYCSHCSWLDWSLDPPRNTSTRSKPLSREKETSIRWYLLKQKRVF